MEHELPNFYIVEVSGRAAEVLFPEQLNIRCATVGSFDFPSDMLALQALETAVSSITRELDERLTEVKDFNPEHFPTLPPLKLTPVQLALKDFYAEYIEQLNQQAPPSDTALVQITKNFDALGDFVKVRWVLAGESSCISTRLAINPRSYATQKELNARLALAGDSDQQEKVTLH